MNYKTHIHLESVSVYVLMALLSWLSVALVRTLELSAGSWDVLMVMVLLGSGGVVLLAAVGGFCRTSAAIAAAMTIMAGPCIEAEAMSTVLWQNEGQTQSLYLGMGLQLLAVGFAGLLLQDLLVLLREKWVTSESYWARHGVNCPALSPETPATPSYDKTKTRFLTIYANDRCGEKDSLGLLPAREGLIRRWSGMDPQDRTDTIFAFVTGFILTGMLLFILGQAASRTQVLFALIGASAGAPMILLRYFPNVRAAVWSVIPLMLGVGVYTLGLITAPSLTPYGITRISPILQLYPLDWIVGGMGGAMLGCWYAERSREHHAFDALCEAADSAEDCEC
ncbi:MAG: hypothetical protein HN909_00020 [Phycisphaerales bacterium]|jgi:hypothetical protein|nr:hypothetical protein [Phycisphaerales bacterium]MBT7170137.1 hypothetical protein [Phycisphaerales bacterium]